MKNTIAKCLVVLTVSGCAGGSGTVAAPNLLNGKYFMAGDNTCTGIKQISDGRVMCYNGAKEPTGYRDAMTDQQIQMYQYNQQLALQRNAQARADRAAFVQEMDRAAAAIQQ